ncbi:hypothetical protein EUX98_g1270 [Antrodiella citrinella]|uniref:Uncharacterized protein n=1 Tax=Antrodiella citrinella TaxID=2447956 RepID=A0A4S4N3J7_9APHY|nr:hypothetical protein EUX98_g1270 [Antrodiella citrinella]
MSSSIPFFSFTSITLLFKSLILGPTSGSLWFTFVIWAVRLVTLAFLFRTFLGPSILRLISKRLRVRSVSLRSIRGISLRATAGTWHIDRIGLSYHKPSKQSTSRFAIKVEGVQLELHSRRENGQTKSSGHRSMFKAVKSLSPVYHAFTTVVRSLYDYVYCTLDPHIRPIVRTVVITIFRIVIRALPAVVQALDFELESAVVTFSTDVDAKLSIGRAKVDMSVALGQLEVPRASEKAETQSARHKRFASVANLNARLKNSVKRTWDKAWGGTEVAASICLNVSQVLVTKRETARSQHGASIDGMYRAPPKTFSDTLSRTSR